MKRLSITLIAFLLVATTVTAQDIKIPVLNAKQVSLLDVTGKWTGKRQQFSWDRKSIVETFQYEFDLKQEGDLVTGTTTIINSNGEYADMKIEGVIIGNKLHFAEKEVKNAIRPQGRVWCFKSGELYFAKDGDKINVVGITPSYMEGVNLPCSGGITSLTKVDNSNIDLNAVVNAGVTSTANTSNGSVKGAAAVVNVSVYPNPFVSNATISYNLTTDSKVKAEVFDISGRLVTLLLDENQKAGNGYRLNYAPKANAQTSGIFIVKMTVNGEVYSNQLVQMQ